MKITQNSFTLEYKIPEWAMSALVNGDVTGLSDDDAQAIEIFEQELLNETSEDFPDKKVNHYSINFPTEEAYFSHTNDLTSLGDNVVDVEVTFWVK